MLFTSVHFHFFQGCTELEDEELQDSPKQVSAEVTNLLFYGFSFSQDVFYNYHIFPTIEEAEVKSDLSCFLPLLGNDKQCRHCFEPKEIFRAGGYKYLTSSQRRHRRMKTTKKGALKMRGQDMKRF